MADDGAPDRVRRWAGRVKATPSRVEWLFANQDVVNDALRRAEERLDEVRAELAELLPGGGPGVGAGPEGADAGLHEVRIRLDHLNQQIAVVDAALAGHAQTLARVVATPGRDAELARLTDGLGPPPPVRPGVSVFTICWNHGGLLATAVRSGLAVLDALDPAEQGEVIVLDDSSSDETAEVAAALAAEDPRVRVLSPRVNLGLARARNACLHAAGTSHAFQLDADNTASPTGVSALFQVARRFGSAFTYGNVVKVDAHGTTVGLMSNEPVSEPWFRSNYIDTMGLIDVERYRAHGGWPQDPTIEHVDDWAMVHRLIRAGELIGFVPVIAGRYLALDHAFHLSVPDHRIGPDRVARTFDPERRLGPDTTAAFAAHPDLGPLWASPAAIALRPDLEVPAAVAAPEPPARPRLLVIGTAGVANLGDDAILLAGLEQLRALAPDHDLDVLTDGPEPPPLGPGAVWLGTLHEARAALRRGDDLPGGALALGDYTGAVMLGGGSLTSLWSDGLVDPRVVLGQHLRAAGVNHLLSGQGLGPLDDTDAPRVAELVAGADAVSLRDEGSARFAAGVHVQVTGDDALLLPEGDGPAAFARARAEAGVDGPYLLVTARAADYVGLDGGQLDAWADAVDGLAAARGLTVLGLALNEQVQAPELPTLLGLANGPTARRARWRVVECRGDAHLLAAACAGAVATVAHSYHAALFSLRAGVPTLLVAANDYYAGKALGLARLAGLPDDLCLPPGTDRDDVAARLDAVDAALARGAGLGPASDAAMSWWADAVGLLTG